jgi:hypothetical protein
MKKMYGKILLCSSILNFALFVILGIRVELLNYYMYHILGLIFPIIFIILSLIFISLTKEKKIYLLTVFVCCLCLVTFYRDVSIHLINKVKTSSEQSSD